MRTSEAERGRGRAVVEGLGESGIGGEGERDGERGIL